VKVFTRVEPTTVQTMGERFKREAVIKRFRTEDGLEHEFTTWMSEDARCCAIIAVTAAGQVITTYEFRAGPERWMYEIPGGKVEDGEEPQKAALRELKEETGYAPNSDQVWFLGESCRDGYCNATWYYFLATNCMLTIEGPKLDEAEQEQGVETRLVSIKDFLEYAKRDRMTDQAAVLMAYDKLKEITHDTGN
jgi:ADP-ribose diphosphatase